MPTKRYTQSFFGLMVASVFFLQSCATIIKLKKFGFDGAIGYYFGRSFNATEQKYGHYALGGADVFEYFATPELKTFHDFSCAVFAKNFGLTFDFIQQKYDEIWHETLDGVEIGKKSETEYVFYGLGLGIEYRFFADRNKRFNPYVSANAFGFSYFKLHIRGKKINPDYPKRTDYRLAGGLRIKTISPIFVKAQLSYFPRNSILSFSAGLELIF